MLTTAMNLLIALAIAMGVDIDPDLVPKDECTRTSAETSTAKNDDSETDSCAETKESTYSDDPPEIYNGF